MVIGSGPIVIGQAAEFDYSGSQALTSLREEGYTTVVVNSNPATIQTDPEIADAVYLEPLTLHFLEKVIEKERPDGVLSGMGGQTALNLCSELSEAGVLDKYGVRLLGTSLEAIKKSEDRRSFRDLMLEIDEPVPRSFPCSTVAEAKEAAEKLGYPVIVRAAYTLGGTGSGIALDEEELDTTVSLGLVYSRINQVLIEESVLGWTEYEYEVMRDSADSCITVCNMENLDPMGFHTGESIVIAPAQTLTDREHQMLRDAALKIIRALKIEGGCNIQFAVHPQTREYRVIEVNPRVSRSSALASKATGYPIARIAAKIAVGLTLDEIRNPIIAETSALFEPMLDYVVIKIPRWPFDKFRTVNKKIGTQMKSTGEVMGIGRTIEEALLKAIRSLDVGKIALEIEDIKDEELLEELKRPTDKRLYAIAEAMRRGVGLEEIARLTGWDMFFLRKIENILDMERRLRIDASLTDDAKRMGFSDMHIAQNTKSEEGDIRENRRNETYKMVDTCAAEFEAATPYYYSTHEDECNIESTRSRKVLIVGAGPIRIGQGIEFDTCCVHGIQALREEGIDALMLNNNPETVSTDFDISDRLYFDPITLEDILNIIEKEEPEGVILQLGGQTSVNLAVPLQKALDENGWKTRILGTSSESMDIAEDRRRFEALMRKLNIHQAEAGSGFSFGELRSVAEKIGYPVLVRPSYVLGGRGMEIVYNEEDLERYINEATQISSKHPVLVDKYLDHAIEVDVDAISDGDDVFIGGIQEHVEEAGVHSGDAVCVLPSQNLTEEVLSEITRVTIEVCRSLRIIGLINLQIAVKDGVVYILEANPRASRTVPYVSKAIGIPLTKVAIKVMLGHSLRELGYVGEAATRRVAVKAPVFSFQKLQGVDCILGPEMKSTGEIMGLDDSFGRAYYKAMMAAGNELPLQGSVFISVRDDDKDDIVPVAQRLHEWGFQIYATLGTARHLREQGIEVTPVHKIEEKKTPTAIGLMRESEINLLINTPTESSGARRDGHMMRRVAIDLGVPFLTTVQAAKAAVLAIDSAMESEIDVASLEGTISERVEPEIPVVKKMAPEPQDARLKETHSELETAEQKED
ncbi:MAG: carbamoyl-phosphate synthase large subunit [Methanomassiliicoccales archaeon]|nr:MAG: carbamoyl-phosphate synthase large subunit [Methanomassiliicoccales archaeon]